MRALLVAVGVCLVSAVNLSAQWLPAADTDPTYRTGDVGIGNTAPHSKLDVTGTARIGGQTVPTTGAGTEIEYLAGAGTGTVRVYDRSSSLYKILSLNDNVTVMGGTSGNVGIGAAGPTWKLEVSRSSSNTTYAGDTAQFGVGLINSSGTADSWSNISFAQAGGGSVKASIGSQFRAGNLTDLVFGTGAPAGLTEKLRITGAGNVGVATAAPNARLSLGGGPGGIKELIYDDPSMSPDYKMGFGVNLAGISSSIDVVMGLGTGTDNSFNVVKPTVAWPYSTSPYTKLLTVMENGNVGIGTTPNAALDVLGNQTIIRQSTGGGNVQLGDLSGNSTGYLTFATSNTVKNWRISSNNAIAGALEFAPSTAGGGNTYALPALAITSAGGVVIGAPATGYALDVAGSIHATGTVTATFQDLAEWVPSSGEIAAGTVVIVSESVGNTVVPSTTAYDTRVAGVVSPAPGLLLGTESPSKSKIATSGRVKVRVDASKGAIHLGDLLVTSDTPGTAMKSEPLDVGGVKIHRPGTLIGKALEPMAKGQGEILVLLSLQ